MFKENVVLWHIKGNPSSDSNSTTSWSFANALLFSLQSKAALKLKQLLSICWGHLLQQFSPFVCVHDVFPFIRVLTKNS